MPTHNVYINVNVMDIHLVNINVNIMDIHYVNIMYRVTQKFFLSTANDNILEHCASSSPGAPLSSRQSKALDHQLGKNPSCN